MKCLVLCLLVVAAISEAAGACCKVATPDLLREEISCKINTDVSAAINNGADLDQLTTVVHTCVGGLTPQLTQLTKLTGSSFCVDSLIPIAGITSTIKALIPDVGGIVKGVAPVKKIVGGVAPVGKVVGGLLGGSSSVGGVLGVASVGKVVGGVAPVGNIVGGVVPVSNIVGGVAPGGGVCCNAGLGYSTADVTGIIKQSLLTAAPVKAVIC